MPELFESDQINIRPRNVADSVKLCTITDVRLVKGKSNELGKPSRDIFFVTLALAEAALDADGEALEVGYAKDIGFGWYPQTQGEEKLDTTNRITGERIRELIIHALGLPLNHKNPREELKTQGGYEALRGKQVLASFANRKGNQNIDEFLSPAAATK